MRLQRDWNQRHKFKTGLEANWEIYHNKFLKIPRILGPQFMQSSKIPKDWCVSNVTKLEGKNLKRVLEAK